MEIKKIEELKKQIEESNILKARWNKLQEQFKEANFSLLENIKTSNDNIEHSKDIIKIEALEQYKQTNIKKMYGGIGIRTVTKYNYDKKEALEWSKEHGICLSLDEKQFKQIAKIQNVPFVKMEVLDTVTFPKEIVLNS